MAENDWKKRLGVVYSTAEDFGYVTQDDAVEAETPEPGKQKLTVTIDRRNRGGFTGREEDLRELGKILKVKCGVGGTAKDGEITIQGDFRDKVTELLCGMGYKARRGN